MALWLLTRPLFRLAHELCGLLGVRREDGAGGQTNPENVDHVLPIARHQIQPTVAIVAPTNSYFLDAVAASMGGTQTKVIFCACTPP